MIYNNYHTFKKDRICTWNDFAVVFTPFACTACICFRDCCNLASVRVHVSQIDRYAKAGTLLFMPMTVFGRYFPSLHAQLLFGCHGTIGCIDKKYIMAQSRRTFPFNSSHPLSPSVLSNEDPLFLQDTHPYLVFDFGYCNALETRS